ncbi:unnamed protein product [Cladocopium goreaui]|uniref:Ankyrin repeat domain-containing protein 50 n=1 Tax=Cladocopium goreaui TaxID=2562237 RepID=A0A9P1G5L7_9DINO|nr:unnamed protein product [Cladocopium goreaui]
MAASAGFVVVRSINGEEILGPLETEGVTALKMQLKSLPAWSEGDISLMTSEGEILTAASPLAGGTAAEPLILTAVLSEQTWQAMVWGVSLEMKGYRDLADDLTGGLTALVAGQAGFAGIKRGGRAIFWRSGDSDDEELADAVPAPHSELSEGVQKVYVNDEAFAAIKEGGQVLAWGSRSGGGFISEDVAEQLPLGPADALIVSSTGSPRDHARNLLVAGFGVAGRAWPSAACGNIPRVAWMSACGRAAAGVTLARRAVCGLKRCGDASVCVTRCLHAAVLRRSWLWRGRPCVAQCCVWEHPARGLDVCVRPCCGRGDSGASGRVRPKEMWGCVCVCDPMSTRGRAAPKLALAWPAVRGPVLRVGTSRAWPGCLRAAVLRPG